MSMLDMKGGSVTSTVLVDKRFTAESDLERNISTQSSEYVRYAPIGGVSSNQIEIQVEPSASGYIDLKNSYIASQVRIRKSGTADANPVDLTSLKAFTSLLQWSDIKTYINDVEVSDENSGLYPYSAFAKVCLEESNLLQGTLTTVPGGVVSAMSSNDVRNIEGIIKPDSFSLCGGITSMTSQYMRQKYFNTTPTGGFVDVKTKPKDAIWQQPDYLPPNCRLRIVLTKNADAQVIEDYNTVVNNNTLEYNSCFLYLKKVYPTPSMATVAKQVMLERGLLYTLLRARTAQVAFNTNQTTLSVSGLLASQNPSLVIVGFYQDYTTAGAYKNHPFNSAVPISSLYVRVGGERIPANYDYERSGSGGGANSLIDYNEYLHACKASSLDSTLSDNDVPLLSYEAYQTVSFYVFNCKRNQETMFGRDDSSNVNGAVDVYARFPGVLASGQARMIVIGLGHDKILIDKDSRVTRLGW
jgi:hypothetical protein